MQAAFIRPSEQILGNCELTFLGYSLESLGRMLDPVLTVIAIGRQQPDHFIGAACTRTCDVAGRKVDGLSNGVFVLQRPSPSRKKRRPRPRVPLQQPTGKQTISLAQSGASEPRNKHMANARILQVFQYDKWLF